MSSSSVPAASATASSIPQVSGIPEQCYGKSSLKVTDYMWNGTVAAEDSVCAANYNDITLYCCQQAGGEAQWGIKNANASAVAAAFNRAAKNANGTASPDCGLQICKLPTDKEADFMYCQGEHGAEGSCQGSNSSSSNATASGDKKDEKKDSAALRISPAGVAMAVTFFASAVLAL